MGAVPLTRHWHRQQGRSAAASEGCRAAILQAACAWLQPRALGRVQESIQQLLKSYRHCAADARALLLSAFSAAVRTGMLAKVLRHRSPCRSYPILP